LRRLAESLFGDQDPSQLLYRGRTYSIEETDHGTVLGLPLPFASREDLSLIRSGDELTVQVRNARHNVILPRSLQSMEIRQAKFEGNVLNIVFEKSRQEADDERQKTES
jgi:arsenite-transporting ATPase